MIPLEFLTNYLRQYEVTPGELEVIAAVLNGKTLTEVALELGIKTNAVRKRLGEVYYKFEIVGKGPGKLIKLQQRLISAYQAHTANKRVVLVWSGEIGQLIAGGLKRTILKHPQIEVLLCTQDLSALSWRNEVEPWLDNVQLAICCLHNTTSAINFNLGWLVGRIKVQLLFSGIASKTFTDFPSFDARNVEDLSDVLESLIGDEAKEWLNYQLLPWQNTLRTIEVHKTTQIEDRNWSQIAHSAQQAIAALTQNQYVTENGCFQRILLHSLAEINHQLETRSSHLIPASLYPRYLNSLQRRSPITIKALTLVDRDENFWQQEMGREIRSSTQKDSVRVFVFSTPNMFERNFEILLEHAEKYAVRVVSYQKLAQDFPEYCKSFGIIAASGDKLLAEYVAKNGVKYNRFDAEVNTIQQHEKILTDIINSAVEIRSAHLPEPEAILAQMRQIRDLVFERSRFAVKSVGISQYLSIEHYDRWGQQQDFYSQSVQQMLALCQHHNRHHQSTRILEVGAKTGHFTQYLTKFTADIWALELDWVCFKKLEYNLAGYSQITLEHKDSCAYDPPYQFDYIFSCLGDRQIEFNDKEKYFKNIKRNLRPNGLFIVGDEFLPPHDRDDPIARQTALENYHNYRLSQAQQPELKTLTREITHCALNHLGDYKLSCDRYEELLRQTGFIFTKQQIDDSVYEKVGGVFIYKAWLDSEQ